MDRGLPEPPSRCAGTLRGLIRDGVEAVPTCPPRAPRVDPLPVNCSNAAREQEARTTSPAGQPISNCAENVGSLLCYSYLKSNRMKSIGMVVFYLLLGIIACFISMIVAPIPQDRGGTNADFLAGVVYGAPTWLVSFPLIFFVSHLKIKDRASCFVIATLCAFPLTIFIPYALIRAYR